ncbi:hypothetical protein DPEC_G00351320 [Dallia pectoralis]|uniref:Uncharacterized protein n=1 Tax=Dallia pectoralis TaxID=75939 RepID=A0ACC2F1Z5_DALPE|nr:hypothetical protein DPEC_G00351320 [Dallia pectoralis]
MDPVFVNGYVRRPTNTALSAHPHTPEPALSAHPHTPEPALLQTEVHHGQESGVHGFSSDMQHSACLNEHENTSSRPQSVSSVRPIDETEQMQYVRDTCANRPVKVSATMKDPHVVPGQKDEVNNVSLPRHTEHGHVFSVMENKNQSSARPLSEVLTGMPTIQLEPNAGKFAESSSTHPSSYDVMSPDLFPNKSLSTTNGANRYKKKMQKFDANRKDEDTFNLRCAAQDPEESKGILTPPLARCPVNQGVDVQSPRQQKGTHFNRRGIVKKRLKLFLLLLFTSALIQDCDGICIACHDAECANVQSIYGLNDTLLYDRCMTDVTICSHSCMVHFSTTPVIIDCPKYNGEATTLDLESKSKKMTNISVVACPTVMPDGAEVHPANTGPAQDWWYLGHLLFVAVFLCCGVI